MLKEALDRLVGLIETGNKPLLVPVPGEKHRTLVFEKGAQTLNLIAPPAIRTHSVTDFDSFIAAVKRWDSHADGTIWVDAKKTRIMAILNDEYREDFVLWNLEVTSAWEKLRGLESNSIISQADLIRLLRVDFPDTVGREKLLQSVRNIKFRTGTSGVSNIQHGNESMGKTIENEVTGVDASIEQGFVVNTPIFFDVDSKTQVTCDLEIQVTNQKFRVAPLPDLLDNEIMKFLQHLAADIREQVKTQVLFGSP